MLASDSFPNLLGSPLLPSRFSGSTILWSRKVWKGERRLGGERKVVWQGFLGLVLARTCVCVCKPPAWTCQEFRNSQNCAPFSTLFVLETCTLGCVRALELGFWARGVVGGSLRKDKWNKSRGKMKWVRVRSQVSELSCS